MAATPNTLFITGTSRSGTTTMADFLRLDQRIVMGRERYGYQIEKPESFGPALFEKQRFCIDFRLEDSHHTVHQPYYEQAYSYFDQAAWVGDKIPNLFEHYQQVIERFPSCKIIYMARNPYEIADSFQKRADKTKQQLAHGGSAERLWPVERDWSAAVDEINLSVSETVTRFNSERFFVVDYSRLYLDPKLLEAIYEFLELPLSPQLLGNWQDFAESRRNIELKRQLDLTESQRSLIAASINWSEFSNLLQHCR